VEIEQFDTAASIHAPDTGHAGAAQVTGSIVKYGKLGHDSPCKCVAAIKTQGGYFTAASGATPGIHSSKHCGRTSDRRSACKLTLLSVFT